MNVKLPISAFVVTYNEEKYLEDCLKSIQFCKEIIVIDLGSTDNSKNIGKKYSTKFIESQPVPIVEIIHSKFIQHAKFDWVLITDPDEVTKPELANQIVNEFDTICKNDKVGAVRVPWIFHFKNQKLKGTVWGGVKNRRYLLKKEAFSFLPYVHVGKKLKSGFFEHYLKLSGENYISHYWMDSWSEFIRKHKRYLKKEGESRYNKGKEINIIKVLTTPFLSFWNCFYLKKGYQNGKNEIILCFFWSWYNTIANYNFYLYKNRNV